jgi:hypothetical protein
MTTRLPEGNLPVHDDDLLVAVNKLSDRVQDLTEGLTVSEHQAQRTRRLTVFLALFFACVLVFGFINANRIQGAVDTSKQSQTQQCENANSARAASISLWSTVIGFSAAGSDIQTKAALAALLDWINALYQQRDCADLDRVYEVPAPPDLSEYLGKKS